MQNFPFSRLNPEAVLNCVEDASGRRLLNICRPHSSYINRVFELQDEDGDFLIAKFFRPGRWTEKALLEELEFLTDCAGFDIPVIPPFKLENGGFLSSFKEIPFALYPKCGGRLIDEYSDEQWLELGRLIGRVHTVGALKRAAYRNRMHPCHTLRAQADFLLEKQLVPDSFTSDFTRLVTELIDEISGDFEGAFEQRIHGDCHAGNLIYRPGESFYIIDFDDMVMGPPIQDFWMLLPGPVEEAGMELELLIEGYETFRPFDRRSVRLIEPLRAMRYIHYLSWCGWQVLEDGETKIDESFGSFSYWQKEVLDLEDQLKVIREGR